METAGHRAKVKEFPLSMKHSFVLVAALASGLVLNASAQSTTAPAASSAAVAPAKIAVIAFQIAVAQTNEGQRNFADLQKKFEPKQVALKKLSDEVDTLTKQLQAQAPNLTAAEQQSRSRVIDDKKKQLDRDSQDAQSEFQQSMQDMYNSLASKVYDVMQAYAQLKGYNLVLDISQQQSPVLWANADTNITKDVIDAYNSKSGVPAPPPGQSAIPEAPKPVAPQPAK